MSILEAELEAEVMRFTTTDLPHLRPHLRFVSEDDYCKIRIQLVPHEQLPRLVVLFPRV